MKTSDTGWGRTWNAMKTALIAALAVVILQTCVSWHEQPSNLVTPKPPAGVTVYRDLNYDASGNPKQTLDLYLPPAGNHFPVIVLIHGGEWCAGGKGDRIPVDYLRQGYALAAIDYRLSQDALFPAQLEDCKSAVRWLRAHAGDYHLDADHIGAWGSSAGGHLVALLGTTGDVKKFDVGENLACSSRVQAVVDFYGPTDFLQMDDHRLLRGMVHNQPNSPESMLVGGLIAKNRDKVEAANPITYISAGAPPFLIVHGDADPAVPHYESEILTAALQKAGVPVIFYSVKNGKHGEFTDPNVPALVREFFSQHLKTGG